MFRGEFYVVEYEVATQGNSYSEIVPSDKIRCPNIKYLYTYSYLLIDAKCLFLVLQ